MINTKFMQHLMLALAILLLAGIAKKYHIATDTDNSVFMQIEKMQESKTGVTEEAQNNDDEFFMYGAPALYDSFL